VTARFARRLGLALAAGAIACDAGDALLGGARTFREIDAAEAERRIDAGDAWLVQVRSQDAGDPRAPDAEVVAPDQPLPAPDKASGRATVVVAHDDPAARRYASRLVRAGFSRVFALRGGVRAWRDRRSAPSQPYASSRAR
jgi:rhodanese-related sulfurtransferase